MTIVRWEPFRELSSLQTEMNRLFNAAFEGPGGGTGGARRWTPAMDLLETDEEFVLRADLVDELECRRSLARDDVRMVIGRDDREPAILPELTSDCLAVLARTVVQDDLAAVALRRFDLHGGRIRGHHDDPRHAEHTPGQRDGLRVVAR